MKRLLALFLSLVVGCWQSFRNYSILLIAGLLHKKLRQCDGDMEEHQNPSVTAIPSSVPVYRRICQLLC